jgi:potassium channel subfamily K
MSFITYLLLGALVYSHIEGWEYLNAVYWADVTLLTIGLGDFSPETAVGRGLLFPFAIGGVLMVGLVVGSIRSLILERGKEKLGARVMEKRRSGAVHNVDSDKKTIKISLFASADYDPEGLSPAQQREEEFRIMRKVSISRISLQTRVV